MKLPAFKLKQVGFTLIELLIVIAIIAILISIGLASFSRVQKSSRDNQRNADLRNVAGALENFYSDFNRYPEASGGNISDTACSPATPAWGTNGLICTPPGGTQKTYIAQLPGDPLASRSYHYQICTTDQTFELSADLENDPPALPTQLMGCSRQGADDLQVTSRD